MTLGTRRAPALLLEAQVREVEVVDLGLRLNHAGRPPYFQPGEWTQRSCTICGVRLWVFHDARYGYFKVGWGEAPRDLGSLPRLSAAEARRQVAEMARLLMEARDVL